MTRYSEVSYTYSGGSKVFTIPFSYLKTEHINVFIDDVEATDFEFNTTSQIQINDEITSGQVVKIVRTTPIDSRMVNFNDRSVLNAQQQNLDSNQLFNVVQEVYDRNDNFTVNIQTQVDTANTNASAAISTANTASSKADTAVSTANAAETKADNAVSTANSTISIANTASTNATNAVNTANSASSAATAASNKVDEFGQSIETVVEAASKINQLEQSVATATNAAITATNKASEANTSATTASQKVTEITNLITDFNNQKGQANGIAPLDANTKLQLIHIPTGVELTANKGVANGYAGLDADGKVPAAQLPKTIENKLTNCVLEAPNGFVTYSGNTITIKEGLKVLIPNGRNADGTLKNIEYTLSNDVSAQAQTAFNTYTTRWALFIDNTGTLHTEWTKGGYFIGRSEPHIASFFNQHAIWFDTDNNYIKYTGDNGSTWNILNYCFLGDMEISLNTDAINSIKLNQPIRILTKNDDNEIGSYSFPSDISIELPALGASGTVFTAPANGYLVLAKQTNDYNQYVQFNATSIDLGYRNNIITGQEVYNTGLLAYACMPMLKGQSTTIYYSAGGTIIAWRFIYAEGEVH